MIDIIFLNESQSQIGNKNDSLNSSSSIRSLNSFIDLLSKNKPTEDPSAVLLNNNNNAIIPPSALKSSISRNILTHSVLRNPHISPAIKMKMNAIIADSNIGQTIFNRYQLYSNSRCIARKTGIDKSNSARLSTKNPNPKKSFTFPGSSSIGISTSMQKINEMKQRINSSIVFQSNANSCRNKMNTPTHFLNTFRQTNGVIASLKKKNNEKNRNRNSNSNSISHDLNVLSIPHNREISAFNNKKSDFNKKNNHQLLSHHQHKYTSRLFM